MSVREHLQLARLKTKIRAEVRRSVQQSLAAFGKLYLPHHVEKPGSRMHAELYPILEVLPDKPGARDRKSTRLNSSHITPSRMPSSA